jgi:hypothetical protein
MKSAFTIQPIVHPESTRDACRREGAFPVLILLRSLCPQDLQTREGLRVARAFQADSRWQVSLGVLEDPVKASSHLEQWIQQDKSLAQLLEGLAEPIQVCVEESSPDTVSHPSHPSSSLIKHLDAAQWLELGLAQGCILLF